MRNIFGILVLILVLSACSEHNFTIEGKVTNSNEPMIYLDKLEINGTTPYDSAKIDSEGKFKFTGDVNYPTFFLLRLSNQRIITLLVDSAEQVTFSADYLNYSRDYLIEGSTGSLQVKMLNNQLSKTNTKIDSLRSLISLSINESAYEEERQNWISEIDEIYEQQEEFSIKFVEENPFSMASVLAIYQRFNDGEYVIQDLQTLKMVSSALHSMYPNSVHAQTLYRDTEKLVQQIRATELREYVATHGENSPDINLPNYEGNEIRLSSLRGKVVLVQFWSAADRGSRIMNQVLAENYKLFNSKGFEIYQVSVDTDREAWLTAIEDDRLTWINVGDMKGSRSAAIAYNVTSIPENYLLDEEGNILAKDLRGPALHRALNEILNQQ